MNIDIKQSHIDRTLALIETAKQLGTERELTLGWCRTCPVAQAISEQFPEAKVQVIYGAIYLDETRYCMPEEVLIFITRFDEECVAEPFSFELESLADRKLWDRNLNPPDDV